MKAFKITLIIIGSLITSFSFAQNNTLPVNGNVGIGTTNPNFKLEVCGKMKVDSAAKFKNKLVVSGLTKMKGNATIFGTLKLKAFVDTSASDNRFLHVNNDGETITQSKGSLFTEINEQLCRTDAVTGEILSVWTQKPNPNHGILHTGANGCATRVGIGTENPNVALDVRGTGYFSNNIDAGRDYTTTYIGHAGYNGSVVLGNATGFVGFNAKRLGSQNGIWQTKNNGSSNGGAAMYGDIQGSILFTTIPSTGAINQTVTDAVVKSNTRLFIHKDGNIGIGTEDVTDDFKLSVNGFVRARKVVVNLDVWADYVFESDYSLKPLNEVEKYIQENKHLPEVPSEKDVKENGLDLGKMDAILLKKIEELTLYILAQDKRIQQLEKGK